MPMSLGVTKSNIARGGYARKSCSTLVSFSIVAIVVLRQFSLLDLRSIHVKKNNINIDDAIGSSAQQSERLFHPQHPSPPDVMQKNETTEMPVLKTIGSTSYTFPKTGHPTGRSFQKRYANSPFQEGYKSTGGALPRDNADFLASQRMWKYVDNNTCLIHNNKDDNGQRFDRTRRDWHADLNKWQHRAPYAIILGAMKCGTHALTESLWEHPLVARNGHWELHFFNSDRPARTTEGIDHWKSRKAYAKAFRTASPEFFQRLVEENETKIDGLMTDGNKGMMIAFESSPRYLLNSDRLPHLIVCVVPWVKFLVLLRDPIARAESQYRFLDQGRRESNKPMVDWTTWIDDDYRLLKDAGFWSATTREQERLAWKTYQRKPNSNMIIGRGLYVVQLLDYFDAMDAVGKPRSDMLVLQSERFRNERQSEYNKVLNFLELPPHTLQNSTDEIHATGNKNVSTPMPHYLRRHLRTLYQPYNDRLYNLLGWNKVWD